MTLKLIVAWSAARSLISGAAAADYGEVIELRRLLINESEEYLQPLCCCWLKLCNQRSLNWLSMAPPHEIATLAICTSFGWIECYLAYVTFARNG